MAVLLRLFRMLDQRFPASLEAEFKQSLEAGFVNPIYIGAVLAILASAWQQFLRGIDVANPLTLFLLFKNIGTVLLSVAAILTVASRRWLSRRWFHTDLEVFVVVLGISVLASTCWGCSWSAALLFGKDPYEAFAPGRRASEVFPILSISIVTTASSLAMPLRSHLLWVLPTVGVSMFSAVVCLCPPQYINSLPELFLFAIALSGFSVFGGFRNEAHLRKEWLAERQILKQTDLSEKQRRGFSHLLKGLCDCLLQLGPSLEIMEPCPNLAAMLFLGSGRSLEGTNFCDYIASRADQDRFVEAMGKCTSEDEPAGILSLHLRDTHGQEVQVHVYHTSFSDQDDLPYHIIGLAEARERDEVATPAREPGAHDCFFPAIEWASVASESGSEKSENISSDPDMGEISVTVDDSPGLAVTSCTPGFSALCGPLSDNPQLADWIVDKDRFIGVVQIYVNSFCSAQDFDLGQVRLRTPSATSAGIEYLINECTVDAIRFAHGDEPSDGRYTVQIGFRNIQRRSCKRRKRQAVHPSGLKTSLMQKSVVL